MRVSLAAFLLLAAGRPATAADAPKSWRFTTGPTADVSVDNISGKIEVKAAAGNEVLVEAVTRGGSESDRAQWVTEVEGSGAAVKVRARCGDRGSSCHGRATVDLSVKVPPGSRVAVRGVSSDVEVNGVTGELRADTTSGGVQIARAGNASVHSVSGDVRVDGASEVSVKTVSGDVTLQGVQRESRLGTVSGNIRWQGACGAGCRLAADTVSGDLQLALASASSFDLDYRTRSGDFSDGFASSPQRSGREGVHTRIGKGEGSISFHSVSGDLQLRKQ
jgi:hypothetical protein